MDPERYLLFAFLGINALQDLRTKEICLVPTLLYLGSLLLYRLSDGTGSEILLISCFPGLLVFILSISTKGQIGLGDGWIILTVGLQLGIAAALEILWTAFLLLAGAALCFFGSERKESAVFPMVPFLFAAAAIRQLMGR